MRPFQVRLLLWGNHFIPGHYHRPAYITYVRNPGIGADQYLAVRKPRKAQRSIKINLIDQLKRFVRLKQDRRVAVATKPPVTVFIRDRLNAQKGVAAGKNMPLDKGEVLRILIEVVFVNAGNQASDHDKFSLMEGNAPRAMDYFGYGNSFQLLQRSGIIYKNPVVRLPRRAVEGPKIDRHIYFPVLEAEVALVGGCLNGFKEPAVPVRFGQLIGPAPVDVVFRIHANPLQVRGEGAFTDDGPRIRLDGHQQPGPVGIDSFHPHDQ